MSMELRGDFVILDREYGKIARKLALTEEEDLYFRRAQINLLKASRDVDTDYEEVLKSFENEIENLVGSERLKAVPDIRLVRKNIRRDFRVKFGEAIDSNESGSESGEPVFGSHNQHQKNETKTWISIATEVYHEFSRHSLLSVFPAPPTLSKQHGNLRLIHLRESINSKAVKCASEFMKEGTFCLDSLQLNQTEELVLAKSYLLLYFNSLCLERFLCVDRSLRGDYSSEFCFDKLNHYREDRLEIVSRLSFNYDDKYLVQTTDLLSVLCWHLMKLVPTAKEQIREVLKSTTAAIQKGEISSHGEVFQMLHEALNASSDTAFCPVVEKLDELISTLYTMKALEIETVRCFTSSGNIYIPQKRTDPNQYPINGDTSVVVKSLRAELQKMNTVIVPRKSRMEYVPVETLDDKLLYDTCFACKAENDELGGLVSCPDCPRIFHLACLNNALRALNENTVVLDNPTEKWRCTECVKDINMVIKGSTLSKKLIILQRKLENYDLFKEHFLHPIDQLRYESYLDYVTEYVNLSSIGRMLHKYIIRIPGTDETASEGESYINDVTVLYLRKLAKIIENCRSYHSTGSAIYRCSNVLKRFLRIAYLNFIRKDLTENTRLRIEKCAVYRVKLGRHPVSKKLASSKVSKLPTLGK